MSGALIGNENLTRLRQVRSRRARARNGSSLALGCLFVHFHSPALRSHSDVTGLVRKKRFRTFSGDCFNAGERRQVLAWASTSSCGCEDLGVENARTIYRMEARSLELLDERYIESALLLCATHAVICV
jgi:hypothetical protein